MKIENCSEIQKRFLLTLIESKKEQSNEEIEKRLKSLNIEININSFIVALVVVDYLNDYENKDKLIDNIQRSLNHLINKNNIEGYALANSNENFWLVLNDDIKLQYVLSQIKENIEKTYNMNVNIGIGRNVYELSKLNISAAEANEVIQYRKSYDNDGIININDIIHFAYRSRIGSDFSYQKVINSFIVGDLQMIEIQLNTLVEEIRYTPKVSKSSIRRVMIELTVNVLNIASNMNVDVDKILNGVDPYTWIISQGHTEIITAWFMELCTNLINQIKEQRQKNELGVIEQSCKYIDDNISSSNLNLVSVSDFVGLTPSYLSQLFKNAKNIGINNYITNKRIEKSKYLIKNTKMKIDDIAKNVGYNSACYFNQAFKKEVGISPTKFREKS